MAGYLNARMLYLSQLSDECWSNDKSKAIPLNWISSMWERWWMKPIVYYLFENYLIFSQIVSSICDNKFKTLMIYALKKKCWNAFEFSESIEICKKCKFYQFKAIVWNVEKITAINLTNTMKLINGIFIVWCCIEHENKPTDGVCMLFGKAMFASSCWIATEKNWYRLNVYKNVNSLF